MQFIQENLIEIIAALGAVSEVLSLIPGVKSNGIFQLIYGSTIFLLKSIIKLMS